MSFNQTQTTQTSQTQATQGGSGTGPTTLMISGVNVDFPCKAYPSQMAMMSKVITGLKTRKNCLLESPTGSGKTLALLCSALAWQKHEAVRVEQHNAEVEARQEIELNRQMEDLRRKHEENMVELERSKCVNPEQRSAVVGNDISEDDSSFDASMKDPDSNIVFEVTDDEDDDFKPTKRSRVSSSDFNNSNLTSDSSGIGEALKGNSQAKKEVQPKDDGNDSPYFVPYERRLTVPKIFFGTRTHKQIAQITRELGKTNYRNVRSVVLASREHTCINPAVEKHSNKNEACRELLQGAQIGTGMGCMWHTGARKFGNFGALAATGFPTTYDLEDLVALGRMHKACPYYTTRFLLVSADIIFCPYNYLVDPSIRKSMNLDLGGHVVIFDEAHNMEDAARESTGFSLKQDEIQRAMQDCEKVSAAGNEPFAHNEVAKLLSMVSQWMDGESSNLKEKTFNSSGKTYTGTEFLGAMNAAGMTAETIKLYTTYFEAIVSQRDKQMDNQRERGSRFFDEKPVITSATMGAVENVFRLFTELSKHDGKYRDDFRVALSKDTVRQRRDGNSGPFRTMQVLSLHLWCLNPAVAFEFLRETVHSIVLTSGTLSPMQSFESELGTPFALKLEANHVIDRSQVWAAVVGTGPNNCNLNGSYANAETLKYQDELGLLIHRVCEIMPHGVLCFFPSYRMLEKLTTRWTTTGLLQTLEYVKAVTVEPRSGPDVFQEAMNNFYGAIEESSSSDSTSGQTGAIFFAVCRGKVSEGLDFADNNARAVICIGIPFPNVKDMQVELKREYNNKNSQRGLLSGGEWYEIQAFRALNQALGRCIRHRHDWGAILLIDDRYIRTPRYVNSLSKWIRSSVQTFPSWSNLEQSLIGFRDLMLSIQRPLGASSFTVSQDESSTKGKCSHGGACNCADNPWLGMNKDSTATKPSFSRDGKSTSAVPFANSFSSTRRPDGDLDSNPDQVNSLNNTRVTKENSNPAARYDNFQTPSPVFSRGRQPRQPRQPRAPRQARETSNTSPANSAIASLFARQIQQRRDNPDAPSTGSQIKFVPSNITLSKNKNAPEVVDLAEDDEFNSRSKRPRSTKLKL